MNSMVLRKLFLYVNLKIVLYNVEKLTGCRPGSFIPSASFHTAVHAAASKCSHRSQLAMNWDATVVTVLLRYAREGHGNGQLLCDLI